MFFPFPRVFCQEALVTTVAALSHAAGGGVLLRSPAFATHVEAGAILDARNILPFFSTR